MIFVGDGAALCYNTYKDQPGILPAPSRCAFCAAQGLPGGKAMWDAGTCVSPAELLPDYHRLSQAERERAEREAPNNPPRIERILIMAVQFEKPIAWVLTTAVMS